MKKGHVDEDEHGHDMKKDSTTTTTKKTKKTS